MVVWITAHKKISLARIRRIGKTFKAMDVLNGKARIAGTQNIMVVKLRHTTYLPTVDFLVDSAAHKKIRNARILRSGSGRMIPNFGDAKIGPALIAGTQVIIIVKFRYTT
jgi:hypothetical protein